MWDRVDLLVGVLFRAGASVAVFSSVVMLAMLGCRQPARRVALARAGLIGSLVLIPMAGLAPLPRFDPVEALRGAGVLPHPLLALSPAFPSSGPLGVWVARGLVVIYLTGVGIGLAALIVGSWCVGRLTRQSVVPSRRTLALYEAIPFSGRRRPRLRMSDHFQRPVLLGVFRPTILIPGALDAEAPDAPERLRLSLLHELAHVERSDPGFSLAGRLAQASWFFLPPLCWIRARMHLDHEFLADRRASAGFGAQEVYASSLLEMATGRVEESDMTAPRRAETGSAAGSPLFQRVLMLVHCPFPVEPRPPAWWSGSMPVLILLAMLALACVGIGSGSEPGSMSPRPNGPVTNVFRVSRLAIGPHEPGALGRCRVFELPMLLPDRFQLALEVWGDRASIARCRVLGQRLGPSDPDLAHGSSDEPEAWHQVRVDRDPRGLSLSVDGRPLPADPGPDGLTSRLTIEPPPDRSVRFRNLSLSWNPASDVGKRTVFGHFGSQ